VRDCLRSSRIPSRSTGSAARPPRSQPPTCSTATCNNGGMTETLRDEAERHLKRLAGDHASLREDQWTAISALVEDRKRALVVQRTGWGKSAVYFVATAL